MQPMRFISRSRSQSLNMVTMVTALAPGMVAALLALGIDLLGGWASLEQMGHRALFQMRDRLGLIPNPGWDERIAIIAIDEASLERYGQFPWSRDRYVDLLNELAFVQPAVIGFDILFLEPTELDIPLADAVVYNGNYVVLASAADITGQLLELSPVLTRYADGFFAQGHVHHRGDSDGIYRSTLLCEGTLPSLAMAMFTGYAEVLSNTMTADGTPLDHALNPVRSPFVRGCQRDHPQFNRHNDPTWINWPGPVRTEDDWFQGAPLVTYSFVDVMDGTIDTEQLQNKIVLVGVDAIALDPARSPLNVEPPITGMYVHAAVLDNLLNDRFLQRPARELAIALFFGVGLTSSFLLSPQRFRYRMLISICLPLAWVGVVLVGFAAQWWIPLIAPIATGLMTLLGIQWMEQLEKQQMMNLFAMHVAPETAQLIWSRRGDLLSNGQLPAQELTATVLFMDIRGFTSISEKMPSNVLVSWLNQYFAVMTDCIMAQGGVVDKYIGDAIMAVFGIPFPRTQPEEIKRDAIGAIAASVAMHQRLEELNTDLRNQGLPTIRIGIGIHTGLLTAGSVGSRKRVNYSVFGDTVNMAARLESMTKSLPADTPYKVLISAATFAHAYQEYPGKAFGRIALKGRSSETMTYTLLHPVDSVKNSG